MITFPPEQIFNFVVSVVNFFIMFILFRLVVIEPMQEAVVVREARAKEQIAEAEAILEEARRLHEKHTTELANLDQELARVKEAGESLATRSVKKIEEQAEREATHIVSRAHLEADALRRRTEHALRQRMATEALARARRMLAEHVDSKAQQQIVEHVVGKVGELSAT